MTDLPHLVVQVDGAFALFLQHGDLLPVSFRASATLGKPPKASNAPLGQRCLDADLEDLMMKVKRPVPPGHLIIFFIFRKNR